jgi:hypothetical protein
MVQTLGAGHDGIHGIRHWARVLENGRKLAEKTGAMIEVVELFALFHDSQRQNDGYDPGHGSRGARLAEKMRGNWFDLSDLAFDLFQDMLGRDRRRTRGRQDAQQIEAGLQAGFGSRQHDGEFRRLAAGKDAIVGNGGGRQLAQETGHLPPQWEWPSTVMCSTLRFRTANSMTVLMPRWWLSGS